MSTNVEGQVSAQIDTKQMLAVVAGRIRNLLFNYKI